MKRIENKMFNRLLLLLLSGILCLGIFSCGTEDEEFVDERDNRIEDPMVELLKDTKWQLYSHYEYKYDKKGNLLATTNIYQMYKDRAEKYGDAIFSFSSDLNYATETSNVYKLKVSVMEGIGGWAINDGELCLVYPYYCDQTVPKLSPEELGEITTILPGSLVGHISINGNTMTGSYDFSSGFSDEYVIENVFQFRRIYDNGSSNSGNNGESNQNSNISDKNILSGTTWAYSVKNYGSNYKLSSSTNSTLTLNIDGSVAFTWYDTYYSTSGLYGSSSMKAITARGTYTISNSKINCKFSEVNATKNDNYCEEYLGWKSNESKSYSFSYNIVDKNTVYIYFNGSDRKYEPLF